jgi:hypothetical protein
MSYCLTDSKSELYTQYVVPALRMSASTNRTKSADEGGDLLKRPLPLRCSGTRNRMGNS